MRNFLLVFFLLYGALHLYAFLIAKAAFDFGILTGVIMALFFAFMVIAPVIIRQSENAGLKLFARGLAWVGYTWLGVIFLFFSTSLLIDVYRLAVYLGSMMSHKDLSFFALSAKSVFFIPLVVAAGIAAYGYKEALNIRTEHVIINTLKLPVGVNRIRIAQISDVHLGLIVRRKRLGLILDKVKEASPEHSGVDR